MSPTHNGECINELIIGIEFEEIADLKSIDIIELYNDNFRPEFPKYEEKHVIETWYQSTSKEQPRRYWFLNDEKGNFLIQLQRNRFLHNWRRIDDDDSYCHYEDLFQKFLTNYGKFLAFLHSKSLNSGESLTIKQCELTYINHIIPSSEGVLKSRGDVYKLLLMLKNPADLINETNIVLTDTMSMNRFDVVDENIEEGYIEFNLEPAILNKTKENIYRLTISSRGKPKNYQPESLKTMFKKFHENDNLLFNNLVNESVIYGETDE